MISMKSYFIDLPMKMEPIVSSETSAIRTQTPGNYPKRNKLHLEHGESLKTKIRKESLDNVQEFGNSPRAFEREIFRIIYGQIRKMCS